MDGRFLACASIVLGLCAAMAGCGGDDAKPTGTQKAEQVSLPRPIHPRCGMEAYGRAEVRQAPTEDRRGLRWTLEYNQKPGVKTVFTKVLLIEYPTINRPLRPPARAQAATVAGHRLNVTTPKGGSNVYTAQWQTRRAVYSILAQTSRKPRGLTPPPIARLVACLP